MKHIIDGMEVETSDYLTASVGDYTVRDGKGFWNEKSCSIAWYDS